MEKQTRNTPTHALPPATERIGVPDADAVIDHGDGSFTIGAESAHSAAPERRLVAMIIMTVVFLASEPTAAECLR